MKKLQILRITNNIILALSIIGYFILWKDATKGIEALDLFGLMNVATYINAYLIESVIISILIWLYISTFCENAEYKKEVLIEHLGGDAVKDLNNQQIEKIYENIFTKLKNKLSRKVKLSIQKIVLKFVEGINYQRSQPGLDELQNYMRTGKITPGDSEKIKKYFLKDARAYGWTFGALATAPFSLLWLPILGEICTLLWKKWGVKAIVPTKDNDYWKHSDAAQYDKMDKTSWTRKVVRNIQKIKQTVSANELIVKVKGSGKIKKIKKEDWEEIISLGNEAKFEIKYKKD